MNTDFTRLFTELTTAIGKYRLTFGDEEQLQQHLAQVFFREQITFKREFHLSEGDRLDFMIYGFAIEVKVGGSVEKHLRQMKRYNNHPAIAGTILICTRPVMVPETLSGKPVASINIGGNRL